MILPMAQTKNGESIWDGDRFETFILNHSKLLFRLNYFAFIDLLYCQTLNYYFQSQVKFSNPPELLGGPEFPTERVEC